MTTATHTLKAMPPLMALDLAAVRADFPLLADRAGGRALVYLDNAATSQKPRVVIDAVRTFYEHGNANVHRGVYRLSESASAAYEHTRVQIASFIGARTAREIIFTRGTTEAINLVAQSYARPRLAPGDEILITAMEHHSNIVPWQLVCGQTGAVLRVAPVTDAGELDVAGFEALLGKRTRLVALTHVSNALGTINPVTALAAAAHARGVPVLVDAAQSAPHLPLDVQTLGCDFLACSSHKMFGPTGVGILYGREALLDAMPPWQGGGDMIDTVTFEESTWADLPAKFEAGTPNISGVIGLGAAVHYLESLDRGALAAHEDALLKHATDRVSRIAGVRIVGTAPEKIAVVSFVADWVHPHDLATVLDDGGICVRAGHHCAQPLMRRLGVPATARASFAFYNTLDEVDALADALASAHRMLA